MNEKDPPQVNEAQTQAKAERARLARAFLEVFGSQTKRNESQRLVFEHLKKGNDPDEENAFRFDARDGLGIIAAGLHRDGAQSLIRIINRQLRYADEETFQKPSKPKPKTTR